MYPVWVKDLSPWSLPIRAGTRREKLPRIVETPSRIREECLRELKGMGAVPGGGHERWGV
jgi:hypothetical protein